MALSLNSLTLRRLLFALGAFILGVNFLSAFWDLRNSRAMVERDALRNFGNLSALIAEDAARSLESIGILLDQASGEIARGGITDPEAHTQRLQDRIAGFPRIRALAVTDRSGRV